MLSVLNLSNFIAGGSCHNFDEELDPNHNYFDPVFRQGSLGISLDYMVHEFDLPHPNHLKIDVDGNEYKVVHGMIALLKDIRLKTIWIELNSGLALDNEIIEQIIQCGFKEEKSLVDTIETEIWNTTFNNRLFVRE